MRPLSISTGFGLFAMCCIGLTGCSKSKTGAPPAGQAAIVPHHHHHGSARGLHGGHIIGLDVENYHAELTQDEKTNRVGVYVLGEDTVTAAPIDAKSVTIKVEADDKPTEFILPAVAQSGDPAGKSSYFELVSEPLLAVLAGKSQTPNPDVQLSVAIEGKPHFGDIDTRDLVDPVIAKGSAGPAADDALLWVKVLKEQGYDISLGHHGVTLLAGKKVEPAAQITRDGKPIADAKVFNALLEANGKTVLAEEAATVYEPPSAEEPSHYAQGALKIPRGTREAVIRYRIVLPEGKGEHTYDVPVAVK